MLTCGGHCCADVGRQAFASEVKGASRPLDERGFPREIQIAAPVEVADQLRVCNEEEAYTARVSLAFRLTVGFRPYALPHVTVVEVRRNVASYCDEIFHTRTDVCNNTAPMNLSPYNNNSNRRFCRAPYFKTDDTL